MALVTYKYMVERMPIEELRRTFAARQHTLEYLVTEMRGQIKSKTLKSYFLSGPRGAGKTTLVRMLALRLEEDAELHAAWLPVIFPEEIHGVVSLRDLLSAVLRTLGENGTPQAQAWHMRVEQESNDEASRDLAIQALQEIVRTAGRRLVIFVENLDMLFADGKSQGIGRQESAALRRLLMSPTPWMMLVGTGVSSFKAIEDYDEALFQYFQPVPIDRLNDAQVRQLLFSRAEFDGLPDFETKYRLNQDKIRSLTRLTGGNPRLVLMLYETITAGAVTTIMQTLLSLVDTLTPLLKDVIEHQMTRQQAKVFDALMRAGGTAQPRDLVAPTRLTLNAVNTQLTRLKEMQLLEVLGGGKGRQAYYSVPDRLLSTWYQLRYLRPNRRRIELFVEFLRLWFEEDARCEYLRSLVKTMPMCVKESSGTDTAYAPLALECVAASLKDTQYAKEAEEVAVKQWLAVGKLDQAACALAEFAGMEDGDRCQYEKVAYDRLSVWALRKDDLPHAIQAANEALLRNHQDCVALHTLGFACIRTGNHKQAEEYFDQILSIPSRLTNDHCYTRLARGLVKGLQGNHKGEMVDYTAVIELPGAPADQVVQALLYRATCKGQQGDIQGKLADYTAVIGRTLVSAEQLAKTYVNRGHTKGEQGDDQGALLDYNAAIELPGALPGQVAEAYLNRGIIKGRQGDGQGAMEDCTAAIDLPGTPANYVARCLAWRGFSKMCEGDVQGASVDLQATATSPAIGDGLRCIAVEALLLISATLQTVADGIEFARQVADGFGSTQRARFVISLLRSFREPPLRPHWPRICRALCENQPPEVAEQLRFLLPVCDALESNDRSKLDPLPPEQRDFALEVLQGFENPNEEAVNAPPQARSPNYEPKH